MKYNTLIFISILIGIVGAPMNGLSSEVKLPQPEEIYEAFQRGLIDFDDYQRLLEISHEGLISSSDSAFITQFPDLLAGFSPNLLIPDQVDTVSDKSVIASTEKKIRQAHNDLFLRQHHKIEPDQTVQRLFRYRSEYSRLVFYAEINRSYAENTKWPRRYLRYNHNQWTITLGNFKDIFGMGLAYGYHGQLLTKPADRNDGDKFLYPNYGGSNGLAINRKMKQGQLKLIFDKDKNQSHTKRFFGASVSQYLFNQEFIFSTGYGRINDTLKESISTTYLSFGFVSKNLILRQLEFTIAEFQKNIPIAASWHIEWKKENAMVNIRFWHYGADYPSFFAGGLSSRRSRTMYIEGIDFSYSDKYAGETGTIIKSSFKARPGSVFNTAIGYGYRTADDNQLESSLGWTYSIFNNYYAKLNCYWRQDNLYSRHKSQRRIQLEFKRMDSEITGRIALGYYFDRYYGRNDYMFLMEGKVKEKFGKISASIKLDRIRLSHLRLNYSYISFSYEARLSGNINTYIRYNYRYWDESSDKTYSTIRWDISCSI